MDMKSLLKHSKKNSLIKINKPPHLRWFFYFCSIMKEDTQYIFGTRAIIEAIEAGKTIGKLYLLKEVKNTLLNELITIARKKGVDTSYVPSQKIYKLVGDQNHQGAVASISKIEYYEIQTLLEKEGNKTFLLLDGITDVRNIGSIIRSAECAGVSGIILPKNGIAPINNSAIKTSAGAAFKVPICRVDHLKDAIFTLQGEGFKLFAATEKTDSLMYDCDLKAKNIAIVMGSEEKGVHKSILKLVDEKVKIPLLGTIESLNVAVACSVVLYEVVRQNR